MKKVLTLFFLVTCSGAFAQTIENRKLLADDYFESGRYWDAFFLYRNLAKSPDYQGDYSIENQVKNSSRAMFLWRKTNDYRAFQQFDIAKNYLSDLLVINPHDPNRGLLPVLSLEMGNQMKRKAIASSTAEGQADYLSKALSYYNMALNEGIKDDMVFSFIRQVENTLEQNPYYSKVKQPTTYEINYQKDKEERSRQIEIIKEDEGS